MIRQLLLSSTLLLSSAAFAASYSTSGDDLTTKEHNAGFKFGFNGGGVAFGADYEYRMQASTGVGGFFHNFQKDDDAKGGMSNGYMIVGGQLTQHFFKKAWDLAISPGFAIINIDSVVSDPDDTTTFGPALSIALFYQVNEMIAVGFENTRYWVWLDEDFRGMIMDDFGLKARASF